MNHPPATLHGSIDVASRHQIAGWVQATAQPFEPVSLLITCGDIMLARGLANTNCATWKQPWPPWLHGSDRQPEIAR
jgi:hypothetical protein